MDRDYQSYKKAFSGRLMPFAFVDLDLFDQNVASILVRSGAMQVCVATKSLRCIALLRRILSASPRFSFILAYSVREAVLLHESGFDHIRVAYPAMGEVEASGVVEVLAEGADITLMVDAIEHVQHLERIGQRAQVTIPLCLDIDLSKDFPGLHFGVRRSGITTPEQALALWRGIQACDRVRLDGVMGYEAQIAGVPDRPSGSAFERLVIPWLKRRSLPEVASRRAKIVRALREAGCTLRFVNGGGTGSVESTIREESIVTEVTVGSGFYAPTQFDHYDKFRPQPAAGFAIEITRKPIPGIYTCQGGGYVASGAPGWARVPQPYLPAGAKLLPLEGAGEVQTPIQYLGPEHLELGDPVFLRHAKAGELCEHFNSLLLLSGIAVSEEALTYRGMGKCFL